MSSLSKLTISLAVVGLAVLAGFGQFLPVREIVMSQGVYTSNAGQLVGGALVGQTFVAETNNLSAIAVQLATYSNRANTKSVEFHLRDSVTAATDLRMVTVNAAGLKDNQMHEFDFAPIADSAGKTYFFYITSPQSVSGNAITVDINTQDPYFSGSAYIVHGASGTVATPAMLASSGKVTVDLVFQTLETVPLRQAVVTQTKNFVRDFIGGYPQHKGLYLLYLQASLQALGVMLVVLLVVSPLWPWVTNRWGEKKVVGVTLAVLFLAAIYIRHQYAISLPITDDEGGYLYDAHTLLQGHLAGGDGYVKAPLVIAWIAFWEMMLGHTVMAGRWSSIVIGSITILPMYSLAKNLWGRRTGLITAALWALAGTAVVSTIYTHTQPLAIFFGVLGLATILMAMRGTTPTFSFLRTIHQRTAGLGWFFLGGVLLGLGVASRKSILALGLVPLLIVGVEGKGKKSRLAQIVAIGAGFLLVMAIFALFAWLVYGPIGITEAIGLNSTEDSITTTDPDQLEQIRDYSLHGMTPFFRESLPIIFGLLLGAGIAGERFVKAAVRKLVDKTRDKMQFVVLWFLPKLGWILAWGIFAWAWNFFFNYEGQAFMQWGIPGLWFMFLVIGAVATITFPGILAPRIPAAPGREVMKSMQPTTAQEESNPYFVEEQAAIARRQSWQYRLTALLLPLLWLGGLSFLYANWIKFHANYISEFIAPIVLIAGYGFYKVWQQFSLSPLVALRYPILEFVRRAGLVVLALVMFWALYVSNYITYLYEHTGTFDQHDVQAAADWAKANIPAGEPIFTGAAVVPYVSGQQVSLNISHPRWYAYDFIRDNPERLKTFLPTPDAMVASFEQAKWVLSEEQTVFSFFNEYDVINNGVKNDFVPVKSFDNDGNTMTFYERVKN